MSDTAPGPLVPLTHIPLGKDWICMYFYLATDPAGYQCKVDGYRSTIPCNEEGVCTSGSFHCESGYCCPTRFNEGKMVQLDFSKYSEFAFRIFQLKKWGVFMTGMIISCMVFSYFHMRMLCMIYFVMFSWRKNVLCCITIWNKKSGQSNVQTFWSAEISNQHQIFIGTHFKTINYPQDKLVHPKPSLLMSVIFWYFIQEQLYCLWLLVSNSSRFACKLKRVY
jgi:hypothetical protein